MRKIRIIIFCEKEKRKPSFKQYKNKAYIKLYIAKDLRKNHANAKKRDKKRDIRMNIPSTSVTSSVLITIYSQNLPLIRIPALTPEESNR